MLDIVSMCAFSTSVVYITDVRLAKSLLQVQCKTKVGKGGVDVWLSPAQQDVTVFSPLLEPVLRQQLRGFQIDIPSSYRQLAPEFLLTAD